MEFPNCLKTARESTDCKGFILPNAPPQPQNQELQDCFEKGALSSSSSSSGLRKSLPDAWHRSRHIRPPAAQSKLRSSAHGLFCLPCAPNLLQLQINLLLPVSLKNNRDFTLSHFHPLEHAHAGRTTKKQAANFHCLLCAPPGARTLDPNIKSVVLYQLS